MSSPNCHTSQHNYAESFTYCQIVAINIEMTRFVVMIFSCVMTSVGIASRVTAAFTRRKGLVED